MAGGGAVNQARRRSACGAINDASSHGVADSNNSNGLQPDATSVTVGFGSAKYVIHIPEPDNDMIIASLASRGIGGTKVVKTAILNYFCEKNMR